MLASRGDAESREGVGPFPWAFFWGTECPPPPGMAGATSKRSSSMTFPAGLPLGDRICFQGLPWELYDLPKHPEVACSQ